jgi:hypothetical protein
LAYQILSVKIRPTKHCTGLPKARFFGDGAPAKMPLVEVSLADPAAGERWRWADKTNVIKELMDKIKQEIESRVLRNSTHGVI